MGGFSERWRPLVIWGEAPNRRRLEVWGKIPHPPEKARRSEDEAPSAGDFCNFSKRVTHFYAYFGQNSCLLKQ